MTRIRHLGVHERPHVSTTVVSTALAIAAHRRGRHDPGLQPPELETRIAILRRKAIQEGLSIEDLCGRSRSRVLVTARHIAMYLCREFTDLSLPKIGPRRYAIALEAAGEAAPPPAARVPHP
jgi:hypothetical protein